MNNDRWQDEMEAHRINGEEEAIAELFAKAITIPLHSTSVSRNGRVISVVATDSVSARDKV